MKANASTVLLLPGCLLLTGRPAVHGAESITNSFTHFLGNSGQSALRTNLAAAGFEVADATNAWVVAFDQRGAIFGTAFPFDEGRNIVRTKVADYATVNFEATISFFSTNQTQDVWFGLGGGERALWGSPDWATGFSSALVWANPGSGGTQNHLLTTFRTQDDLNEFVDVPPQFAVGHHRIRMAFNPVARTMLFTVDLNSEVGPFVSDISAPAMDVSTLFGPTGWPTEPSRVFFAGDDNVILKDLVITVTSGPLLAPTLKVEPVAPNSLRLRWSTNAVGYKLQQNISVGTTNWQDVTNTPVLSGTNEQITLLLERTNRFYRLIDP